MSEESTTRDLVETRRRSPAASSPADLDALMGFVASYAVGDLAAGGKVAMLLLSWVRDRAVADLGPAG